MPLDLPVHRLIQFDDEFAEFFSDPGKIAPLEEVGCAYDASNFPEIYIRVSDTVTGPRILLRNVEHVYLLFSFNKEKRRWSAKLAPDPKGVLEHLYPHFGFWRDLLPLITAAGVREESTDMGKLKNPKYLEELMIESYLTIDPLGCIRRRLNLLTDPGQAVRKFVSLER
jgi:hypothetical protein